MGRRIALAAALAALPLCPQDPWLPPPAMEERGEERGEGSSLLFVETGASRSGPRSSSRLEGFLGLDGMIFRRLSESLRGALNARMEGAWRQHRRPGDPDATLFLREAYLSWRPSGDWAMDLGRMHVRDGVALGFNPTDPFRKDSLGPRRNLDPAQVKNGRLGVLAWRFQYLAQGRGISFVLAPRCSWEPGSGRGLDPRLASTNGANHAYLKLTPGTFQGAYLNLLGGGDDQGGRLLGLNLTGGLGRAAVAYLEAARLKRQEHGREEGAWFGQAALGATYSMPWNLTIGLECRHNGAPILEDEGRILQRASRWQEPVSRDSLMAHFRWDRFLGDAVKLSGVWQRDGRLGGDTAWVELAYDLSRAQASLGIASFSPGTAAPRAWSLLASLRIYLG